MHGPSWDVCNLNLSRGDSLRSPFFSSRTGVFMHRCALNSDSQGPPSAAAALMVTEQLLRRCREFSALLRGTSAVVFKGGESINHWLSLRWRSANSAPSLSLAGFSNTQTAMASRQQVLIMPVIDFVALIRPLYGLFFCTALSLYTVQLSVYTFFPLCLALLAGILVTEALIPVESLLGSQ